MSELCIDKNVPVPHRTRHGRWDILAELQVGDSVLCPNMRPDEMYRRAWWYGKRLGFKFVTRAVFDDGELTGTRVWRTA